MATAFTVVLVDRWGHPMRRDGTLLRHVGDGERPFQADFPDIDAARRFCEEVVREMPHVECDVLDQSSRVVLQHRDEAWHNAEDERVRRALAELRRRDRIRLTIGAAVIAAIVAGVFLCLGWA